jgi:hypothetical protein
MVVFFDSFSSSGQNGWCFFQQFLKFNLSNIIFTKSSKTEMSSAGEQLIRDSLMTDRNVEKGILFESLFLIFQEVFIPSKTHQ